MTRSSRRIPAASAHCLARFYIAAALCIASLLPPAAAGATDGFTPDDRIKDTVIRSMEMLAGFHDRSTGTNGCREAADIIADAFRKLEIGKVGRHHFTVPVRACRDSFMVSENLGRLDIQPFLLNAISPEAIPPEGLEGPLVYAGNGDPAAFNGKKLNGAIVLMDITSGKSWLDAAALGAAALIYIDGGISGAGGNRPAPNIFYTEKTELSPIRFPRFRVLPNALRQWLGGNFQASRTELPRVRLTSRVTWHPAETDNIYLMVPGADATLREELIIVETFYDSTALIPGQSPGADEASGIATLLALAEYFKFHPPARSVLLTATSGHAQTLAGMREMIWSIRARSKFMNTLRKSLRKEKKTAARRLDTIRFIQKNGFDPVPGQSPDDPPDIMDAFSEPLKSEIDRLARKLMRMRMAADAQDQLDAIQALARQRSMLQKINWATDIKMLDKPARDYLKSLIPATRKLHQRRKRDADRQLKLLQSARKFRAIVKEKELAAVISLHLSSHGDGVGAFNQGWMYPLKPSINRIAPYSALDDALKQSARSIEKMTGRPSLLRDTLRPSRLRAWQSYLPDRPPLGGEISSLAACIGITLATVNDARMQWGTPADRPENVDPAYAGDQAQFICALLHRLCSASPLQTSNLPRDGFSTVRGNAKFLRHGEIFPDQPAPGTVIMAFQGPQRYYAIVDERGEFLLKGVADKKHMLDKVIIEGYRFDPESGAVLWAIDKERTGKPAYRVKMNRRYMQTDLVMFACRETTLFHLLEPRNFNYMTKIQLLDARREAQPLAYWYSRIDTRVSTLVSVYMAPQARLKMILSDSVLHKKMILTHATPERPDGIGYRIDANPKIPYTHFRTARDMWALLAPRIKSLETHGIYDEKIRTLQDQGLAALSLAEKSLGQHIYDRFDAAARRAWGLATRVYDQVDQTQKDVLFGVLFYIALFVPFAFCLERLLFAAITIHRRILAFCAILVTLIAIIYQVHPAFQLAYSPLVVVLAFFIIGLSALVSLIIFFRFEDEMKQLQRRSGHVDLSEISRGKAFAAAFLLGVGNLRRRPLRTALTCTTLIILTFTIMSFTTVKSMRHHARVLFQKTAPYQGMLFKNVNWRSLPPEAARIIAGELGEKGIAAPRAWREAEDPTRHPIVPVSRDGRTFEARGLLGLTASEPEISGLDKCLTGGRWFKPGEQQVVILPDRMARRLGIDPASPRGSVNIQGMRFDVVGVFSARAFQSLPDLDGESPTPVTFPREVVAEMTEAEMEALESGDDIKTFQSRYEHTAADLTLIFPYETVMAAGGDLKSVAVGAGPGTDMRKLALTMTDRFGLSLFSGEPDGTYLYQASDTLQYSGVPNIIIPLLISVFIVLNTMIGSVYERKREIGIYTSVGLAPSHVAFLFMAEAMAFAVLSVVSGYVIAQVSAGLLAGSSLWSGVTVNYSSLSGVAAMLLVIAVVLASTIYPAKTAADIAIPDVNRAWTLPDSTRDTIELTLPFMIRRAEMIGAGGYLHSYFKNHQDVSHGVFSTGKTDICIQAPTISANAGGSETPVCNTARENLLVLSQKVWLAPFDFGIMQTVDIVFRQSPEDEAFLEIHVRLTRKAGEVNTWWRINKRFLNRLRKQLLIWRSLEAADRENYAAELDALYQT